MMSKYAASNKLCPILRGKLNSKENGIIPIIISYKSDKNMPEGKIVSLSNKLNHELPIVNGCSCEISTDGILELYRDPDVEYISYDTRVFAIMDVAKDTISFNKTSIKTKYTGKDVTVAIIDTGVSPHKDLIYPQNRIIGFKDFINDKVDPYDDNGHGTHCAGILAGNGLNSDGKYSGIAPECNVLSLKVLDENGNGKTSDILSAVQWIINTKDLYKTKIVNFSLGAITQYREKRDPLVKAANSAIEHGMIVIAAVGNSGPLKNTILSPATGRYVISVGAIDDSRESENKEKKIAGFSSRGPTIDRIKKPDLVAPGVDIVSLSNEDLEAYTTLSGTSMSAPMVSGAAALLLNENPNYTHFDIKRKLINGCSKIKASAFEQGAGILNISKLF